MTEPVRPRGRFLVFGAPTIEDEEINEVADSMRAAWLGTGPKVARFEDLFAGYVGITNAVALNSCTAALHLALLAAGIGPGDEVIIPSLTFCATANAVIHAGARPVVADVDQRSMNLTGETVRRVVSPATRAIIPVHFAGRPCPMDEILMLARERDLVVIEDCAHAIETQIDGRHAGTFGDIGCYSFYATKNITTGEGGMLVTERKDLADRVKVLGLHGMTTNAWRRYGDEGFKHYEVVAAGFKYNMMDLQAAIGIHQLGRVAANWERRRIVWQRYNSGLAGLGLTLPADPDAGTRHALHLYTIQVAADVTGIERDEFLSHMTAEGIGVGVHYRSLTEHPFYQQAYGWRLGDCPTAERIGRQTVSLPLSPGLSPGDTADVVEAVRRVIGRADAAS